MAEERFLFGFHAVAARLRQAAATVREIYLAAARQDPRARELARLAAQHGVRVIAVEPARLDGMVGRGARHQGVVARAAAAPSLGLDEVLDALAEPPLLLVLDGVQDPRNLGACLRVADAAGAHAVVAPKDRAAGLTAAAVKVASGAADTVPYVMVTNLARTLRALQARGIRIVGTDAQAATALYDADLCGPLALVLGAEGHGLRRLTRQGCDVLVRIPMFGCVDSLNVSVAAGLCLYEARRRRPPPPRLDPPAAGS